MPAIKSGGAFIPPSILRSECVVAAEIQVEAMVQKYRQRLRAEFGLPARRVGRPFKKSGRYDPGGKPYATAASALFAERVREARECSGLENKAFAALAGVSAPYVSQILAGQTTKLTPRLREAVKVWGVDLTELPAEYRLEDGETCV